MPREAARCRVVLQLPVCHVPWLVCPPWLVQSDVVLSEEGVGTFGKVYACKEEGTVDRVVAVKVVRDVERCVWVEPQGTPCWAGRLPMRPPESQFLGHVPRHGAAAYGRRCAAA